MLKHADMNQHRANATSISAMSNAMHTQLHTNNIAAPGFPSGFLPGYPQRFPHRVALRSLLLSSAILLASGCAVSPDYESALDAAPAQQAFVTTDAAALSTADIAADWWKLYNDAALNALVEEALTANADLRAAEANLRRVDALWRETRTRQLPSTTVDASETYSRQNFFFGPTPLTVQNNVYNVGLNIAYQVDLFGKVRRAIEAARADSDAVFAATQAARITVVANTVRSYAAACHAGNQLSVAQENLRLQTRRVELTQQLLNAGRGTRMELATASAQLEQTRAVVPLLQTAQQAALFQLAALLGRTPDAVPEVAAQCSTALALNQAIPTGDGAQLLRRRPDVLQAERELAAATARVGLALGEFYPSVNLGAGIGSAAQSGVDLFQSSTEIWNYGANVSWAFPNILGTLARVRQAEASVDVALARFDSAWLNALRETETAMATYLNALERRTALAQADEFSSEAASLAQLRFEAGQISYLDVLQVELAAVTARSAAAAMEAEVAALQVDLFLALGGGWLRK
jgi:NodT family efflux transporter outer membrane factor (OMF) lipoprotein